MDAQAKRSLEEWYDGIATSVKESRYDYPSVLAKLRSGPSIIQAASLSAAPDLQKPDAYNIPDD